MTMKRKILLVVSLFLAFAMMFSACKTTGQNNDSDGKKILNMNSQSNPGSLHPALAQGTHESIILDHVFEGLTKRTPEGKIVAGMAKDWKTSADNLTYTFTLRDGIKWSNGDPVTAQDFEYAWKYALNPLTASDYAFQLYYLAGGAEFNSADPEKIDGDGLKALEDKVGVKALNDTTLEVKLAQPTPYFLELCAFYTYYPVDKKVQEANAEWANDGSTHVSNGPFKIVEWNQKSNIVVKKNEYYYNAKEIKLDGIDFAMTADNTSAWQSYESGNLDVDFNLPPDVLAKLREENNPDLTIGSELAVYFYRFNTTVKPFDNLKIRQALSMAIDRQTIVDKVAQGGQNLAFGLVPPGIPMPDGKDYQKTVGNYFKEDVEKAKQLLKEGLAESGMNSLSFTILYNTDEGHKAIAQAVQEMWRNNLGVEVQLENTDFQVKIDREHALDYQVSRAGWIGDYVDPMTFLDMWASESTQNDTGWTDENFDKYIQKAKTEFDQTKRFESMKQAEALFMKDLPVMPIYFYTRPYVVKPNVKGIFKVVNRDVSAIYADIE